jgi:triosephosphate isomerase
MGGSLALAGELTGVAQGAAEVVICPPAIYLRDIAALLKGTPLKLGGQDCHPEPQGAFTGDISAGMLKEAGCEYVLAGHSERRQYHGETDALVAAKTARALAEGLTPIVCVGESLAERDAGQAEQVVAAQVRAALGAPVFAYEPVWAIGSGRTPTAGDIAAMHRAILVVAGEGARVLYGGSVKPANAQEILSIPGVSGVLVGGASLNAQDFRAIIAAAA